MNQRAKNILVLIAAVFVLASCAGSSEEKTYPNPTDPADNPPTSIPTDSQGNPIPLDVAADLVISTALRVQGNYTGLADIMAPDNLFLPLVGDARLKLTLPNTRAQQINSGNLLLGVEDQKGLWWLRMPIFAGPSIQNGSTLDLTFADSIAVIRVNGQQVSNEFNATVYYRIRQATDPGLVVNGTKIARECEKIVCSSPVPGACGAIPDTTGPCLNFMNTANSAVKELGTIKKTSFSEWTTLSEEQ